MVNFRGALWQLIGGVGLLCCVATAAAVEIKQAITLEEAIQEALAWHPSIATAKARLEEQAQRQRQARAGYYPQVSANAQSGYQGRRDEQKYSQALTLSVSQMLYDFGKVRAEVAVEKATVVGHQAGLLKAIEDTLHNTSAAVFEIWRFQRLESMAKEQHQALSDLTELVSERHLKGAASRSDVAQSKSRVESAFTQVLQYRNQKLLWQNRLASLLGKDSALAIGKAPKLNAQNSCAYTEASLDAAPSLIMALAERDSAAANADKANARMRPTISLDPSLTHHVKAPNWSNQDAPDKTEYGVYLNVNMPLYQGGALSAERKLAHASRLAAESEILSERQRILETLFTSASQLEVFAHQRQVLERREILSIETRELYQQQYLQLGARPLIDLLNAEQEIYQTRFERINIDTDTYLMGITCAHELGQLHRLFELGDAQIQGVNLTP